MFAIIHTFGCTYTHLVIAPSGQISIIPPRAPAVEDFTFGSLEGITYQI